MRHETDDSILVGPDEDEINQIIQAIQNSKLDIRIESDLQDFLGLNILRKEDGIIHWTQPHLNDKILTDLGMQKGNVKLKTVPISMIVDMHLFDDEIIMQVSQ
jgi:hypothetical protein